jgi:hypothetical protein
LAYSKTLKETIFFCDSDDTRACLIEAGHRGVNLISDALSFSRLWYAEPNAISNAVDYAKFRSRSHDAGIRIYDEAGNVIEVHRHKGELKEW